MAGVEEPLAGKILPNVKRLLLETSIDAALIPERKFFPTCIQNVVSNNRIQQMQGVRIAKGISGMDLLIINL